MYLSVITDNFQFLMISLGKTWQFTISTLAGGLVLGTVFALMRLSDNRFISYSAIAFIEVVRGTPILMLIFWVYFMLPVVIGRAVEENIAGLLSLLLFNTAYSAEIIRAGIQSVPFGQIEAGRTTGLSWLQILRYITLPQAFSNMMPALISQAVMLYKTTSLIYVIGVVEFFRAAIIINNREFVPYTIFIFVGLVYLIPSTIGSRISRAIENRRHRMK